MSLSKVEEVLTKNYYKKKPNEPFVKGRTYYFLDTNKLNSIRGVCKQENSDGSCLFLTPLSSYPIKKEKTEDAWWRYGNSITSGDSVRSFQDYKNNGNYGYGGKRKQKKTKTKNKNKKRTKKTLKKK
jgi:hypothetical protein